MIQILNAEPIGYSEKAKAILRSAGEVREEVLDREGLIAKCGQFDVLIVRLGLLIDREVLEAAERLKFVVSATTGLDHIDVEYANSRGITVLSLRGETEFLRSIPATAEHTWALLLALIRQIPSASASVCNGEWDRDRFRGNELYGKNLGIVGLGRVGEQVARFGQAFQMAVGAYDPHREDWSLVERYPSLKELVANSNVVSLHVPLNEETNGLFGTDEFRSIKHGAVLVNTSRGAVLDEIALLEALQNGRLAGAALDVVTNEIAARPKDSHALVEYARTHGNLIITPHLSGATHESMARTEEFMAEKLKLSLQQSEMISYSTRQA